MAVPRPSVVVPWMSLAGPRTCLAASGEGTFARKPPFSAPEAGFAHRRGGQSAWRAGESAGDALDEGVIAAIAVVGVGEGVKVEETSRTVFRLRS